VRVGLCAGFGETLSPQDWSLIRSDLGFCGIRQDIPRADAAPALITNIAWASAPLSIALVNVRGTIDGTLETADEVAVAAKATGCDARLAIEVGNEEDINGRWGNDPRGYGHLVASVEDLLSVHAPRVRVVTAGIGTISRESLAWLAEAMPFVPASVAVGYHPYRSSPPGVPRKGYSSREAEFAALRAIAGDRALWCTEIGWHTAPRPKGFPLCWMSERWSDSEVASFLRSELRLNAEAGAEAAFIFQLNDGADQKNREHRFGIRRMDGSLKPSAQVAREIV